MPAGTVEVFLIGAVGIKDTEIFGKADPYAVLICGRQKLRSNTASNQGSKPIWNQKFSFYVDDNVADLQIKVLNHNILTEDDELGSTVIPLAKVYSESKLPTTSYNVVRPSGRVQGEVKLSITFSPKQQKAGHQQTSQNASGPYNKVYGSPYAPPEPKVKHDPLTGPHGYYKNSSMSYTGSSHGKRYSYSSDSDQEGSNKPYPPVAMDAYPPSAYPPVAPGNESQLPYPAAPSGLPYHRTDSHGSAPGLPYPAAPSGAFNYDEGSYHQSPYGYGSGPPHLSESLSSSSSAYPPPALQNPSYSSVPSSKLSHGGSNQYNRFDDLAGNFAGLKVSGNSSEPNYPGYPPSESSSHGHYPGYPPDASNARPASGYPPAGYPATGYGSQFPGSFSSIHGHEGPPTPSSYYPPHLGGPEQPHGQLEAGNSPGGPSDSYPPVSYYGSRSDQYRPAGYPKQ